MASKVRVRQSLGLVLIIFTLAGCSNKVSFERKNLDQAQTRDELQQLGVTIPDTYLLVSMTKMPPPGSGGSSYDGVYDSPTPPAPVKVDGVPLSMKPMTCDELRSYNLPDGLDCSVASDLLRGSINLTRSADSLSVVSGNFPSGKSHVYVSVSGH